jgi:hypothetical protein
VSITFKRITKQGKIFLYRFSQRTNDGGSIKLHLIVRDDLDGAHRHPWSFSSLLLIGAYWEEVDGVVEYHKPLQIVRRSASQKHKVMLYRFLGLPLPCLTVGRYSKKTAPWCERTANLCDMCQVSGSCVDKQYWEARS